MTAANPHALLRSTRLLSTDDSADVPAVYMHDGSRVWLLNKAAQPAEGVVEYVLDHAAGHLSIVYRAPVGRLAGLGDGSAHFGGAVVCRLMSDHLTDRPCCGNQGGPR